MKKKLMTIAVLLGALSLGACVDDNESQSVTDLREAKTEQLRALANYYNAQAESEKILAEAEAAYQNALAAYQNALAEQTAQEMAQAQAIYEAQLEAIKAQAEADMWAARLAAAEYEQQMLAIADEQLKEMFYEYKNAITELTNLNVQKSNYNYQLAQAQANLLSAQEYVTNETTRLEGEIAAANSQIEAWKNYAGIDKADLETELAALQQEEYKAYAAQSEAQETLDAASESEEKLLNQYNADYYGESSVGAVAAIKNFNDLKGYYHVDESDTWSMQIMQESINEGYLTWDNCRYYYDEENATSYYLVEAIGVNIMENGSYIYRYVNPITEESIELSNSDNVYIQVPLYSLGNTKAKTTLTQYYAMSKSDVEEMIGSPASDSKLATGYYEYKQYAEKTLADAQATLKAAQEAFPKAEKNYKEATDARDEANAANNAAWTIVENAQATYQTAQAAYDEAVTGGDAAAIETAQKALNEANSALNEAWEAYNKTNNALNEANNKHYEAENAYYTAKNNLDNAQDVANQAERKVAYWNDRIAEAQKNLANWDELQAEWNTLVAALEDPAYAEEVKTLAQNETIVAYVNAVEAYVETQEAYYEVVAAMNVIYNLLGSGNVMDPAEEIATLEQQIFDMKQQLAQLEQQYGILDNESLIAQLESQIAGLDEEIAIQTQYIEALKARLEELAGATDEEQPAA